MNRNYILALHTQDLRYHKTPTYHAHIVTVSALLSTQSLIQARISKQFCGSASATRLIAEYYCVTTRHQNSASYSNKAPSKIKISAQLRGTNCCQTLSQEIQAHSFFFF